MRTLSPEPEVRASPNAKKPVGDPGDPGDPTEIKDQSKEATNDSTKIDEKTADAVPEGVPDAAADAGSKKRAREDDDGAEQQGNPKKIDSKVGDL